MTEQKTSEPSERAFTYKARLLSVARDGVPIEWVEQIWPPLCGWYVDTMDTTRALFDLEGPQRAMVIRIANDPISRAALEPLLPPWPDAQDGLVEFFDRSELAAMVAEKHPPLRDAIASYDEGPIIVIRKGIVAVFPVPPPRRKNSKNSSHGRHETTVRRRRTGGPMNNPPLTEQVESTVTTERVLTVRMFASEPTKFALGAVVGPYIACAKWYSQQAVLVRRLACRNGLDKCILIRHRDDAESMETFRAVMPPWPTVDDDACIEFFDRASVATWLQTEHPRLAEAIAAHDAGPIVITVFGWVFVLPIPPERIDGHILRPHHAGLEWTKGLMP